MKLPNISTQDNRGFTLIEILISIGILALIASLGLFISLDFFRSYSFRSEQSVIVSLLQNARSKSLNNINQVRHGVHFEVNPNLKYIIFEGSSYDSSNPSNLTINSSYNSAISSPSLPFDVIFDQLSGTSTPLTITASDGTKSYNVKVNSEGQIDW